MSDHLGMTAQTEFVPMTTTKQPSGKRAATAKPSKQDQALAEYTQQGAHSYADRRLLDITRAVEQLRSMVQLMVVVMLLSILLGLVVVVAAS